MKKNIFLMISVLVFSNTIFSQSVYDFLNLGISPRASALAGSFVSNYDDPNIIFYNPAGIASLKETPTSFSYLQHLVDISSASFAMSKEIENIGRFGAGIQYVNYGDFPKTDQYGKQNGNFSAKEIALIVGYASEIDENFYYGANVKFIFSGIENYTSTGLAFDLGLQYILAESGWSFGFAVQNLGAQLESYAGIKEKIPVDVKLGLSKRLAHTPFTFYFAVNKLNESGDGLSSRFSNITGGVEIKLSAAIKLRLGYENEKRKEYKIGTTPGLAGFNLGFGIRVSEYDVDYSFSSMGSMGALHRFGITTAF
ncbi:MAG: type IX secretion system protein PorQ [Bacteroidota bacterium]